jgi:hypothetical protein
MSTTRANVHVFAISPCTCHFDFSSRIYSSAKRYLIRLRRAWQGPFSSRTEICCLFFNHEPGVVPASFHFLGLRSETQLLILTYDTECVPIENCRSFLGVPSQNVVKSIRNIAHSYGQITLFKAYTEVTSMKASVRSDLQLSGVSLVDCPHNGKKEVADKMMTGICFYVVHN